MWASRLYLRFEARKKSELIVKLQGVHRTEPNVRKGMGKVWQVRCVRVSDVSCIERRTGKVRAEDGCR